MVQAPPAGLELLVLDEARTGLDALAALAATPLAAAASYLSIRAARHTYP